jgi:anti-sigma B factor antagonist
MYETRPSGNGGGPESEAGEGSLVPTFECRIESNGDHPVVVLSGELDLASAPELQRGLDVLLARPVTAITLDVAELTFIDSSGLGALCRIHEVAHEHGGVLVLRSVPPHARRVLEITGLTGLFRLE